MTEISDDDPLKKFMDSIVAEPWGALSRAQLNILIFQLLADTKEVDLAQHDVSIANQLKTTPTKIANLRYQYDQIKSEGTKTSTSYISNLLGLRQYVWWGFGLWCCRWGFSVCGRGKGRSPVRFVSAKK
jgi:hypothetical protein